jgi:hypothetical protein
LGFGEEKVEFIEEARTSFTLLTLHTEHGALQVKKKERNKEVGGGGKHDEANKETDEGTGKMNRSLENRRTISIR